MEAERGSLAVKLFAAFVLFAAAYGGVVLPWRLDRPSSGAPLSLASALSAGVMLGAGLLHLLPDASASLPQDFPYANALFALGLLAPLALEQLAREEEPLSAAALSDERRGAPLLVLCALSFHSALEGLAQGAAPTLALSAELLLVLLLHKGLAAFALGCLFLNAGLSRRRAFALGAGFAAATPLGICAGLLLHATLEGSAWVASAVALAAGSFCYVALLEVLPAELSARRAPVKALLGMLALGFALMGLLALYV
ncbi:hypothetical protein AB1Y20_016182 [Prymnesium parvum]|uniref:Uncharacterized protein n=1 Tax=Prymnesium parvum TaxID=97485 RepID=A0AB34IEE1_PRYPA